MRSIIKAGIAAAAAIGLVALGAPLAASAHTPDASLDCATASVNLVSYDQAATATIVLDGTTLHSGTFGGHLVTSYPTGGGNTEHHLIVQVKSFDQLNDQGVSPYDYSLDTTTTTCYVAPPAAEVTGSVSFADGSCIDGVRVGNTAQVTAVEGVRYSYTLNGGAPNPLPSQGYDESVIVPGTYIVTAEANDPAHYVYVGTASWSHTFAAIPAECAPVVIPPVEPPLTAVSILPVTQTCDSYTVPTQPAGVKYALADINDLTSRPVAGTFPLTVGQSVTINAHTTFGYVPASYTVTVTGSDTGDCAVVVVPPVEPPVVVPPTELPTPPAVPAASVDKLAYTGSDSGMLTLAGAAGLMLLAAGVVTVLAARRRARTE